MATADTHSAMDQLQATAAAAVDNAGQGLKEYANDAQVQLAKLLRNYLSQFQVGIRHHMWLRRCAAGILPAERVCMRWTLNSTTTAAAPAAFDMLMVVLSLWQVFVCSH